MKRFFIFAILPAVALPLAADDGAPSDMGPTVVGLLLLLLSGFYFFASARMFARTGRSRWWTLVMIVPFINLGALLAVLDDAGYRRWWLLLIFVPLGGFYLICKLAFTAEWPSERERRMVDARLATCVSGSAREFQEWLNQDQRR